MNYRALFKPKAFKDLQSIGGADRKRIYAAIERLENDLHGNVKKLENFKPNYRLRVGDFRVLFDLESDTITVYRVVNRRDAYK